MILKVLLDFIHIMYTYRYTLGRYLTIFEYRDIKTLKKNSISQGIVKID